MQRVDLKVESSTGSIVQRLPANLEPSNSGGQSIATLLLSSSSEKSITSAQFSASHMHGIPQGCFHR